MFKKIILLASSIILFQPSWLRAEDGIVAIVNKDVITQSEADAYLNVISFQLSQEYKGEELEEALKEEKQNLITRMIEDRIILQEAKRKTLRARLDAVKGRVGELRRNFVSEKDFLASLEEKGLTVSDLESKLADQIIMREIIEREVRDKVVVSPEEVTKFYEEHKDEFLQSESRVVEVLHLDDESILEKLNEDLKKSADFKSLSEQYKAGYSKNTVYKAQLQPEVANEVFSLKLNELSKPIKIENEFYIFKLLEVNQEKTNSISEVHNKIFDYLFEEKFAQKMSEWLDELKSKAYIVIK